jgi:branched-chain amino acid transport system substrate-binding protein
VRHSVRLVAACVVGVTLVASTAVLAAGASTPHAATPKSAPGVTATQVKVGAIVTQSGGLKADFEPYLDGVNAYFDYVNKMGGVFHRTIDLAWPLDDMSNPDTNVKDAQTLVNNDHAFAIVGVSTPFFTASNYLGHKTITPTFGYATGNVWGGPKNLFADYGSVLNYSSSVPFFAYTAKETHQTKIAVIALSYPSSQLECKGAVTGLKAYKYDVTYSNINEAINANWQIEAEKIHNSGATMVVNCMDVNSDIALSKYLLPYYAKPPVQLWLDGYDRGILSANASSMPNVYFLLQHVPFEAATDYPSAYPGMELYFKEMVAFGFSSTEYDDVALAGWESANLFTEGLRAAGKNPTQAAVNAAINKIKKDFGGPDGGVTSPVNWTSAHTKNTSPACETFVVTKGSNFVLAFNKGSKPWICFPLKGLANLNKPVAPPAGTPGA